MRKKTWLVLAIIFLILVFVFLFFKFGNYFSEKSSSEIVVDVEKQVGYNNFSNYLDKEAQDEDKEQALLKEEGKVFQEITRDSCQNECQDFFGEELTYCQEVCGLTLVSDGNDNCDTKESIEKDYCLKDLAIQKKELTICEEIKDENIKKTCKNRVSEEFFDTGFE